MSSGRIVAELGRPETPEETAARRQRESRLYRERKTLSNLLYALIATVAAVLVLVLLVPRPNTPIARAVDVSAAARSSAPVLGTEPLIPKLAGTVNAAEVRTGADGVTAWYVGWITPSNEYLGMLQALGANDSWVSQQLADTAPSGTIELGGLTWLTFNNRSSSREVGNARYGVSTSFTATDGTQQTVVLFGTATDAEFISAATTLSDVIRSQR